MCTYFLYLMTDAEKYSWGEFTNWGENYAGSSSDIHSPRPLEFMTQRERSATVRYISVQLLLLDHESSDAEINNFM